MPIATNSDKIDISLEVKTAELAEKFSQILKRGDVVFLHGEVGVGKTTFIRHLINKFQINNNLKFLDIYSLTQENPEAYFIDDHHLTISALIKAMQTKLILIQLGNNKTVILLIALA